MTKRESTSDALAAAVQRLGVLLAAGVHPASAWAYLAEENGLATEAGLATVPYRSENPRSAQESSQETTVAGNFAQSLATVAQRAALGEPIGDVLVVVAGAVPAKDRSHWRALAQAWLVASEAGAPLAATLADFAATLRSLSQIQRQLTTALAAPVATARLLMVLPVIGICFGAALGFDTLGILFTTPPGLLCLGSGLMLMIVARFWNSRLIAAAQPRHVAPGLDLDLLAIALSGGASIARARDILDAARERCRSLGSGTTSAKRTPAGIAVSPQSAHNDTIESILRLSARAGIPAAALLKTEAMELRRRDTAEGERRAATLGITLMIPLGLCILPAFLALAVVPLLISLITQAGASVS